MININTNSLILILLVIIISNINISQAQDINEERIRAYKYFKINVITKDDSLFTKIQKEMSIHPEYSSFTLIVNVSDPDKDNHYVVIGAEDNAAILMFPYNYLSIDSRQGLLSWCKINKTNLNLWSDADNGNNRNIENNGNIYDTYAIPLIKAKLIQYGPNTVTNVGNTNLDIIGDSDKLIISIPPFETRTFNIDGQKIITYRQNGQTSTASTKENYKPEVAINTIDGGNINSSLRDLQSLVGFRIKVKDEFLEQLEIIFDGPITVESKGNGVYDVKLNYSNTREDFESITKDMMLPFRVAFSVKVEDKVAGHKVTRSGQYTFGRW
ncbi:MAG: hypothetical protein ACOYN6_00905 [Ignavibacteria bacterium]